MVGNGSPQGKVSEVGQAKCERHKILSQTQALAVPLPSHTWNRNKLSSSEVERRLSVADAVEATVDR